MVKWKPVDDTVTRFRVASMRGVIEKRIRQCETEIQEAESERQEIRHRFAVAQRKMAEQILADFDHVFPLNGEADTQPLADDGHPVEEMGS